MVVTPDRQLLDDTPTIAYAIGLFIEGVRWGKHGRQLSCSRPNHSLQYCRHRKTS
ncbi:hypothetical protein DAEQUDRAFT_721742 [Daedalea quercina L-15889]|uniref:Uncharacterized protein n=1 Tax=Daedalea quercina L-15889 TaxID=1314783 RepID=A0A165TMK7_9APHY|nr:hypothetical protein DAEQUDRAFT_729392 [Daedalea quercina L-15889]KZT73669.1 hypothetical protein DAEQUDRAFT_721742 [Daedalea quercina L-15889]